jgi:hypothetical protein
MRTISGPVPAYERCGHCSLPEALHTHEQRARCDKRLLAELSRSWPRRVATQAERDAAAVKKLQRAVEALTDAMKCAGFDEGERARMLEMVDLLGARIAQLGGRTS